MVFFLKILARPLTLTLVVMFSSSPLANELLNEKNLLLTIPPPLKQTFVSQPPPPPTLKNWTLRAGLALIPDLIRDESEVPLLFGFSYTSYQEHFAWEGSFDSLTNSQGYFGVLARKMFFTDETVRPSLKAGVNLNAKSRERLATVSNWVNYALRLGLGLEEDQTKTRALRLDLEMLMGEEDQALLLTFGSAWSW